MKQSINTNSITQQSLDTDRSCIYALLSAMLAYPANKQLIDVINDCNMEEPTWQTLKTNFQNTDLSILDDEYHRLFIGVGTGELLPYQSHYISGSLMGKPLSDLREYMQTIGLEVQLQQKDPEDHISGIFEIMRLSITDLALSFKQQKKFFEKYILTWVDDFFNDLASIKDTNYHLVGLFGQWFIKIERQYFSF